MSRYSGVVRARSLRLATHLHCRLARRASHPQAETICIPIPSSLLGTGPAQSSDLLPVKAIPDSFEVARQLSRHPSSCSGYVCHRCYQLPSLTRLHDHAPATSMRPSHAPLQRHVYRHTQQLTATSHPPAPSAHTRRALSRPASHASAPAKGWCRTTACAHRSFPLLEAHGAREMFQSPALSR